MKKISCEHGAGFQISKDGLIYRWCSEAGCGSLGVKVAGETDFRWAAPGAANDERKNHFLSGEDQFQGILSSAKERLRKSVQSSR